MAGPTQGQHQALVLYTGPDLHKSFLVVLKPAENLERVISFITSYFAQLAVLTILAEVPAADQNDNITSIRIESE